MTGRLSDMPAGARPPDVSVLIVTRNTARLTEAAVASVFEGQGGVRTETIVIDNASTDGTGELLLRSYPFVRYVRLPENRGFAHANNLAAALSSGRVLLLLNSDAVLEPGCLASVLAYLEADARCAVLGAQLLNPDGSPQNSVADRPDFVAEALNRSLVKRWRRLSGRSPRLPARCPTEVDSVIGAFMAIRRDVWRRLGGLDEAYFFYFEETDFCTRVRATGRRVVHHPGIRITHRQGSSANTVRAAARIEFWRSRYTYFSRHAGQAANAGLRVLLPFRLLLSCAANLLVSPFSTSLRTRNRWQFELLAWHLRGCPSNGGLAPPQVEPAKS